MAQQKDFSFVSDNGKDNIYLCEWIPDGEPKGIVQIAHGVGEHIGRYAPFAAFLNENGFVVAGNDHLGHKRSIKDDADYLYFADSGGWNHVVADMKTVHDLTAERHPGLPYFMFGHSMGSFLLWTYLIKYCEPLCGAVLSATSYTKPLLLYAGRMLAGLIITAKGAHGHSKLLYDIAFGNYNKAFAPNRTPYDWLSTDEKIVDAYAADKHCGGIPTNELFSEMLGGIKFNQDIANAAMMNKDIPVLFISGEKCPLGENGKAVRKAYELFLRAGMKDVSMKLYPGARHELLNEKIKEQVYADVFDWMGEKAAACNQA
jgi:alpha-beta hydrolase superfamily lysophospholipase